MRGCRQLVGWVGVWALAGLLPLAAAPADLITDPISAPGQAKLSSMEGRTAPDFTLSFEDGSTGRLSDHQGRWVYLEFGETACPASEQVALSLSRISDQLHGLPFDFIQVYEDPSWDDIALGTGFPFEGTQARPGPEGIPSDYRVGYVPACFLIDPRGIVVWTNADLPEEAIRAGLKDKIGSKLNFPPDFAAVDPYRAEQEKAFFLAAKGDYAGAEPLWRELLAQRPDDAMVLLPLAGEIYHDNPKAGREFVDQQLAALGDADTPLRWKLLEAQAIWTVGATGLSEAAIPLYQQLLKKYPESFRLRRSLLALTRPVDAYTDDDLALMHGASWADSDYFALGAGIYAFQAKGKTDDVAWLMAQNIPSKVQAAFLALEGHGDEALALYQKEEGDTPPDPATASRDVSYYQLLDRLEIGDWAGALPFADRHFALTPQNAVGPVAHLLCAIRLHDDAAKQAALGTLATFKTDRAAYLFAQQVQNGQAAVTAESVAPLAHDPHRLVGLLWAGAVLEAQGKTADAANAYTLALQGYTPYFVNFGLFYFLRSGLPAAPPSVGS